MHLVRKRTLQSSRTVSWQSGRVRLRTSSFSAGYFKVIGLSWTRRIKGARITTAGQKWLGSQNLGYAGCSIDWIASLRSQ